MEIKSCEVCGSGGLRQVVDLGMHPMCDDLVAVGDDRVCNEYPIEILFCDTCRTAHQRFQIPKHQLFPSSYHYRSRHTADVLNGMKELVAACEARLGDIKDKKVLDVGCNDGSLLSFFAERGAFPFGIEPTGAAADASVRGYTVINDYFSEEVTTKFVKAHGQPDIVTFTNVFAHIEDLHAVIRALKIAAHPGTTIVIENHYLGAILDTCQFDTFYHEHPRTYSLTSFKYIARSMGMKIFVAEFPKRYGGNVRVMMSAAKNLATPEAALQSIEKSEIDFGAGLAQLADKIAIWKHNKSAQIAREVREHGPLPAKAFPGRAAIPIRMLGLSPEQVSEAFEKPGSAKIGHYIPGTHIPIRSDDDFKVKADAPLVNMAWHIAGEIESYLRQRGYAGRIINVIAHDDFVERH